MFTIKEQLHVLCNVFGNWHKFGIRKIEGGGGRLNLLKLSIRLLFYPGKYTRYTDVCVIYRTAHLVMLASSSFNNS